MPVYFTRLRAAQIREILFAFVLACVFLPTQAKAVTLYYALDVSSATLLLDVSDQSGQHLESRTLSSADQVYFWVDTAKWNTGFHIHVNSPATLVGDDNERGTSTTSTDASLTELFGAPVVIDLITFGYHDYFEEHFDNDPDAQYQDPNDPNVPLDFALLENNPTSLFADGVWKETSPYINYFTETAGYEGRYTYPTLGITSARDAIGYGDYLVSPEEVFLRGAPISGDPRLQVMSLSGMSNPNYIGTKPTESEVPEPATVALALVGMLPYLRMRRAFEK